MVIAVLAQEVYIVGTLMQCNASCYQGRYLFPAIAPMMLLLAFGLLSLLGRRAAAVVTGAIALVLAIGAVYMPLRVIIPAYETVVQPKWSTWFLPGKANAVFGDQLRLLGYDVRVEPDRSAVKLGLYWQAVRTPDFNYSAFAHLLDADGQVIAEQDHAPGEQEGYPPVAWQPEDIVVDEHILALPPGGNPAGYRFRVGLYNWETGQQLPAVSAGEPAGTFVLLDFPGE